MAAVTSPPVFHLEDQLWILVVNLPLFRLATSSSTQQAALLSGQNRTPLPTYRLTVNLKPFVFRHSGRCRASRLPVRFGNWSNAVQDLEQPHDMLMQRCQLSFRLQCFLFIHCHWVDDEKMPCFPAAQAYLSGSVSSVMFRYIKAFKVILTEGKKTKCHVSGVAFHRCWIGCMLHET